MRPSAWISALLLCGLSACQAPADAWFVDPDPTKHTVMVLDDGFDLENPVFQGKLLAAYTLECHAPASTPPPASFAEHKAQLLAQLAQPEDNCQLQEGLELAIDPEFSTRAPEREESNKLLAEKSIYRLTRKASFNSILTMLYGGEEGQFSYHGTATAGLAAYQNPAIQLVLVQKQL